MLEQPVVRLELVRNSDPSFVVRIVWFLFVGLWLGLVVTTFAWLAIVSIIGLPLGLWLVNHIPAIVTLRPPSTVLQLKSGEDGKLVVAEEHPPQLPFQTRAVYFVAVGWWLSMVWLVLAYVMAIMIIPLPVAMWMYDQLPAITTLERY